MAQYLVTYEIPIPKLSATVQMDFTFDKEGSFVAQLKGEIAEITAKEIYRTYNKYKMSNSQINDIRILFMMELK